MARFGSCALRVVMAGVPELPASPHPPSLFPPEAWASLSLWLSRGLNFPPVVLTQIGAAGGCSPADRH